MENLFNQISFETSKLVTRRYSTSFSIGVRCFDRSIRDAIYSVYGFVRFADEIVDTFHDYDKRLLLDDFERGYYQALEQGISLNPILNSFQLTVKKYSIDDHLVQSFLRSMRSDLDKKQFDDHEISEYIYGSAEVVGLICLKVFVGGNQALYDELKPHAMSLGGAFQKINFLRDLQHDTDELQRVYFPILKDHPLDQQSKKAILDDIYKDFENGLIGIKKLPSGAKLGVYTAYLYYLGLTQMIEKTCPEQLMKRRISVPDYKKVLLFCRAYTTTQILSL